MFCANCGAKLPDDARFCPDCGQEIEREAEAPAEATRPAAPPTGPPRPVAQVPPQPQPPAAAQPPAERPGPPAAQPEEPPKKGIATCWIVGCIVLFVLAVIFAIGGYVLYLNLREQARETWEEMERRMEEEGAPRELDRDESSETSPDMDTGTGRGFGGAEGEKSPTVLRTAGGAQSAEHRPHDERRGLCPELFELSSASTGLS